MKSQNLIEKAKKIRCVIFDLDGILTDGRITLDSNGNQTRHFHVHDGFGIKLLQAANMHVACITTTPYPMIKVRMQQLGINSCFCGNKNKIHDYQTLKQTLNLSDDEFAYMGDDLPDKIIMEKVGLCATVANAHEKIKHIAHFISEKPGGLGGVRDFCDFLLEAKNEFENALNTYIHS